MIRLARERIANEYPGNQHAEYQIDEAAANAAPKLSLYDATTRGSVTVAQKSDQPMDDVLIKIMDSGIKQQTEIQHREPERQPESRQYTMFLKSPFLRHAFTFTS